MDPFSIALGGIALCQVASKIIQFGIAYSQAVSAAPEEVGLLVSEITLLSGVFTALCSSLEARKETGAVPDGLRDTADECKAKLEELYAFLVNQRDASGSRLRTLGRASKWPLKENDTRDWIARMERYKSTFSLAMVQENNVALQKVVEEVRELRIVNESERVATERERLNKTFRSVLAWLSPANPRENYQAARKLQQRGTGQWFTTSKAFADWKTERNAVIWLHGSAGTGKSILSSIILDHLLLEEQKLGHLCATKTIYFYCDYRDIRKRTPAGFYGSLLAQVIEAYSPNHIPTDIADAFYQASSDSPSDSFLRGHLLKEVPKLALAGMRVVVDGLDECTSEARGEILQTLRELNTVADIRLLLTSRDEVDIKTALADVPELRIDASVNSQDITSFVVDECERNTRLKRKLRGPTKQEVISVVSSQADGMFRWAKCQLDRIAGLRNDKAIKSALTSLPPGLNETYERILGGISADDKPLAIKILRWLACSIRPLRVMELVEGIALELGDTELDPDSLLNDPEDIIEICGSLVQLDIDADTVALGHFSVKEFFISRGLEAGPHADFFIDTRESNIELAKICMTYLCLDHFRDGPCAAGEDLVRRCDSWALYKYACMCWGLHAQEHMETDDATFMAIVEHFFLGKDMEKNFDAWTQVYEALRKYREEHLPTVHDTYCRQGKQREHKPLTYACALGLYSVAKFFLSRGIGDVRARNTEVKSYGTALNAACSSGSLEVTRLIIDAGADVNAMAGEYWLPLNQAVKACSRRNGPSDFRLVELLIERGADINLITPDRRWPLYFAASIYSIEGIKLYLEAGADLSLRDKIGFTVFETVAVFGQSQVFEVLRQYGAGRHIHPEFPLSESPRASRAAYELMFASAPNFYDSAQKILQENGEVMFKDAGVHGVLLHVAREVSRRGYYRFLEHLLAYTDSSFGALPDSIQLASARGYPKTLRVLLDAYKPSPEDEMLRECMVLAAGRGQVEVVEEFVKLGVPIGSTDQHGWTVELARQLTPVNGPLDAKLITDQSLSVGQAVKKPSGWVLKPIQDKGWDALPAVVFEGSDAYLPPGEPTCMIKFNHPVPPKSPYFYFEAAIEVIGTQGVNFAGLYVASSYTEYNKHTRGVCYSTDGSICLKRNCWDRTGPAWGEGSVVGCAVDLFNRIALFTCDGQILDVTIAGVRGMVCCYFRMQPGLKIRSNFGETPFRCDVAELEKRLALGVPENGYTFAFQDRRLEPKIIYYPGDGTRKRFVG